MTSRKLLQPQEVQPMQMSQYLPTSDCNEHVAEVICKIISDSIKSGLSLTQTIEWVREQHISETDVPDAYVKDLYAEMTAFIKRIVAVIRENRDKRRFTLEHRPISKASCVPARTAHVDRTLPGYYIRLSRFEFANRIDCVRTLCALDRPASVRAGPTELAP